MNQLTDQVGLINRRHLEQCGVLCQWTSDRPARPLPTQCSLWGLGKGSEASLLALACPMNSWAWFSWYGFTKSKCSSLAVHSDKWRDTTLSVPKNVAFISLCCVDGARRMVPFIHPLRAEPALHPQDVVKAASKIEFLRALWIYTIWSNFGQGTAWSQKQNQTKQKNPNIQGESSPILEAPSQTDTPRGLPA